MRVIAIVLTAAGLSWGALVYVSPTGTDGIGRGGTDAPFGTIQYAVTGRGWQDTVILEDGTYHENNIKLKSSTSLGITIASRYVLDGNTAHVGACVVDGGSVESDSGSVFVIIAPTYLLVGSDIVFLGFTVMRGSGTIVPKSWGDDDFYGGGIFAKDTLNGLAGIRVTMRQMKWLQNRTRGTNGCGGAIAGVRILNAHDCEFADNFSNNGGAIVTTSSNVTPNYSWSFTRCVFTGNHAEGNGAGVFNGNNLPVHAAVTLDSCELTSNTSSWETGVAMYAMMTCKNTLLYHNAGRGATCMREVHGTLDNCEIFGDSIGDAAFVGCSLLVNNCRIQDMKTESLFSGSKITSRNTLYNGNYAIDSYCSFQAYSNCTFIHVFDNKSLFNTNRSQDQQLSIVNSIISCPGNKRVEGTIRYSMFPSGVGYYTSQSANNYIDWPAVFVDSANGDFRLAPYSPAINAGDPDSASRWQYNERINLGAYGNMPDAEIFSSNVHLSSAVTEVSVRAYVNEVVKCTLSLTSSGTDPVFIPGPDSVWLPTPGFKLVATSVPVRTFLSQNQSVAIRFSCENTSTVNMTTEIRASFRTSDGPVMRIPCWLTVSGSFDDIFPNNWVCPPVQVGSSITDTFFLRNNGFNAITVTNVSAGHPTLSNLGRIAGRFPLTVVPGDSFGLRVTYTPSSATSMQTNITISTPNVIGGTDNTLVFSSAGAANTKPIARITSIAPSHTIPWGQTFDVVGIADDLDGFGADPQIRSYLWLIGDSLRYTTANVRAIPTTSMPIGWTKIRFTAMDNENTWADTASDSVRVTGLLPVVDSLWCDHGLILHTAAQVTFGLTAHDQDEFAVDSIRNGDIVKVAWYSTIKGKIGEGRNFATTGAALGLGTHGFYAWVWDNEGDSAVSRDTLWIPVQTSIGRAVIVAGTAFDDYKYFFNNIAPNTNWAYKKLLERGFSNEQIYYMNPVGWQSFTSPLSNDNIVDETVMTCANLRAHLASIAADVQNNIPLTIYLLGHGSATTESGRFYLSPTEFITPDTLNAWLEAFGDLDQQHSRIVLLLDFCYSGTFQRKLSRPLSQQNRIIISSSDDERAAYFVKSRCFSSVYFQMVYNGENVEACFAAAKQWSDDNAPGSNSANPQLSADGDLVFNAAGDLAIARTVYIGGSQQLQHLSPELNEVVVALENGEVNLTAITAEGITSLWYRVIPPGFVPGASGYDDLPSAIFSSKNDTSWSATFAGPWSGVGEYLFVIDGRDASGGTLPTEVVAVSLDIVNVRGSVMPLPQQLSLHAFCAPGSGTIRIRLALPESSNVRIRVLDAGGRLVTKVADRVLPAGNHDLSLEHQQGRAHGAGVYLLETIIDGKKMVRRVAVSHK